MFYRRIRFAREQREVTSRSTEELTVIIYLRLLEVHLTTREREDHCIRERSLRKKGPERVAIKISHPRPGSTCRSRHGIVVRVTF